MYSDWTTRFFNGLAVEFWIKVAPPPTNAEIGFLREIFRGAELLDLACGAGRYTIPLAAAGYRMTGIDISDDFLSDARKSELPIAWLQEDIRDLDFDRRFDGALCFGNSFGYFDPRETRGFLTSVANALKPGARFVLETSATAESLLPTLQAERWIEVDGITFRSEAIYDTRNSRLDTRYSFTKDGVCETKNAHAWIFTAREIGEMLSAAGLRVDAVYGSAAREPFLVGSPRALFVSTRPLDYNPSVQNE